MNHSFNKAQIVAALDIGTSKVCCIIARVTREKRVSILGYGYNAAKGIKNGVVTDINQATIAVCNAVEAAEQMSNERIMDVIVNVSGDRTRSVVRSSSVSLHKNRPVSEDDVKKVTDKGVMKVNVEGNEPIHFLTMGYQVDNGEEVKNPVNIYGDTLNVNILLGLYPRPMYKNLVTVVESAHLDVDMKAFSAYASGLACLVDDEKELGATIIDIGGGMTSIATFKNGHPVYFSSIPVGGINVTNDIALGLTTSFNYAEEVKNRHGCAFLISQDEQEIINAGDYTLTASNGTTTIVKKVTVSPATISITSATVQDKIYNGNQDATVTGVEFTGLVNDESLTSGTDYTATAAFTDKSAGENKEVTVTVNFAGTSPVSNRWNGFALPNSTETGRS